MVARHAEKLCPKKVTNLLKYLVSAKYRINIQNIHWRVGVLQHGSHPRWRNLVIWNCNIIIAREWSLRVNGAWNFIIEIPETTRRKRFLSGLAKIAIFVLLRANSLILVGGLATKRRAPLSPSLPFPSLPFPSLLLLLRTKKNSKSPLNLRFEPGQRVHFVTCDGVRTPTQCARGWSICAIVMCGGSDVLK